MASRLTKTIIEFLIESILKPFGRKTAMPPALELTKNDDFFRNIKKMHLSGL